MYGAKQLGLEVIPFQYLDKGNDQFQPNISSNRTLPTLDELQLENSILVHGWVSAVHKSWDIQHINRPHVLDYPLELERYFGRRIWQTTLKEIRRSEKKTFIKPLENQKAFVGHISSGQVPDLIKTARFDDDYPIWASNVINLLSEHRIFVDEGRIIGVSHYLGSPIIVPDFTDVNEMIILFSSAAPCSYALDVGVTAEGKTVLVEINDAYSLGCYGLPTILYTRMIMNRWKEIVNASNSRF